MNVADVYGGDWLRAENLPAGQDVLVTIERVSEATFEDSKTGKDKRQIVLHFVGKDRQLGLNITNANTVSDLYGGRDIEQIWPGKQLYLYVTQVEAFGKMTDGIRIRTFDPTTANLPKQPADPAAMNDLVHHRPAPAPVPTETQEHMAINAEDIPF